MNLLQAIEEPGMKYSNTKLWVWLDPSSACTISCRDCYTKENHSNTFLSIELFEMVIKKLKESECTIELFHLSWIGEPLMNRDFGSFLRIRNKVWPTLSFQWHTNCLLLSKDISGEIIECSAPSDHIYLSIDGGDKESHEANRGKGTYEKAIDGARNLISQRNISQKKSPTIGLYQLSYDLPNAKYDPSFIEIANSVDEWVRVKPIDPNGHEEQDNDSMPAKACFWAGNSLCIKPSGEVRVCLLSKGEDGSLGSIRTDELSRIVEEARNYRNRLNNLGRISTDHCRHCKKREANASIVTAKPPRADKGGYSVA